MERTGGRRRFRVDCDSGSLVRRRSHERTRADRDTAHCAFSGTRFSHIEPHTELNAKPDAHALGDTYQHPEPDAYTLAHST